MRNQQIIEIHSIREILKHVSFDTVVYWDVDNTVLQSASELGSDQWFCQLIALATAQLGNTHAVIEQVIQIYHAVQERILSMPVEHTTAKIIFLMQQIGIPQGIITARGACLRGTTERQLAEIGISIPPKNMIFCDGKSKANCLEAKMSVGQFKHSHFIMVDDKASHLKDMQVLAKRMGSRFHGFSYRHLDQKVRDFDIRYAHIQLQSLMPYLPAEVNRLIAKLDLSYHQVGMNPLSSFVFFDPDLGTDVEISTQEMSETVAKLKN
jgi:hypothetical protein